MIIRTLVELTTTLALTLIIRASRTLRTIVFAARRWDGFGAGAMLGRYERRGRFTTMPLEVFEKIMHYVVWPRTLKFPRYTHGFQSRPRTATRKERRVDLVTQKQMRKGIVTKGGTMMAWLTSPARPGTRIIVPWVVPSLAFVE